MFHCILWCLITVGTVRTYFLLLTRKGDDAKDKQNSKNQINFLKV